MKKDLLPTLNFLDSKKFRKHSQKNSKFAFLLKIKYKLLLIFLLFCCSLQAQNNTFTSSGTFTVAAGLTSVTAECWGAGGAGGGNNSGTSAGGGGGGGYSKAIISVTPNTSINYTVGLGPAGSNASGLDGAATVFSTVTANGGKGGTSGSPGTGGLGGTGTIGTGGKGANGSLVIGSVYSGGGGSSAGTTSNGNPGTGLGVGGAAVTGGGAGGGGAVLTGPGSNGAFPGGGGGGALVLIGNGNIGGNGGNGQIKLTYTCPTYNISATSAGTACTSIGDAVIKLTSTTSALPQGNYTVTYNRALPAATGLNAPMTVDGSGVGTFTAAGFTTVGTTSITITKIESGTCSSTLNLPNAAYTASVTVFALSAGGSVAGGTTICSGFTSAALTLSGHTGTVLRWESSVSPFTTWSPVSNATTSTTYTSLALTQTTQFRAVVQNGPCNAIESTPTTVTVNSLPSAPVIGTITGPTCTLATGSIALSGLPSGGVLRLYPGNIVQSYSGTTALISGLSPNTYFFTISSGACTSVNSANAVVPIVPANSYPTISTSGTITVCQLATAAAMVYTATTASPVSYSIQWTGLANQTTTSFAFAAGGGTVNNIVIPANTPAGMYNGIMTIVNSNGCSSTQNVSLTVNANPTITTGGTAAAVCQSTSAQTTSLNYTASTFSATSYSIQWTGLANQAATSFAFAAGGGIINTIAVPANTAAGNYTGIMTISNTNGCSSTQNISLTVNANPTITTGGTATAVCQSATAQTTSLNYTASTFSPTNYSIQWTGMANQTATSFAFAAGGGTINTIAVPANTAAGNYTGIMTISNANGCSSTQNVSLTINANPTITIGGTITAICASTLAQTTSLNYTASTFSPTSYSIQWTGMANQTATSFAFAAGGGTINSIAVPANTAAGNYTGIMTISNANGCSSTQNVSLTVNSNPTITTGGTVTAICASTSAQTTSLNYTASTFSPTSYSIQWTGLANQAATSFAFAAGGGSINTIAVPANTAAGNYTGIMTISNANGCSSTQNISLTVNANPTITTGGAATAVCQSATAQTTSLNYTASIFSPTSYSIQWTGLANQTATSFAFAAGGGTINTIAVPANTAAGNYTGIMTISNANGCSSTQNVSLTVNANPTITTGGTATAICASTSAQTTSLNYTASTFSPTSYSIQWTGLANQTATSFAFAAGGGTINSIAVPANTAAGNYTGIMTISNANGCSSTQNVSLTVNDSPTIITTGVFSAVCQSTSDQPTSLSYNSTTGSPVNYAIDWVTLTDQGVTILPFSSGSGTVINVNVPANTAAGTYNGIMTISTANGCPVNQAVSLTVNAVSAAPTASATQQPSCESNSGSITVSSPASGTGYFYSIDGVDFTNNTGLFTALAPGLYNVKVRNGATGCESPPTPITINTFSTKVWNGSVNASWANPSNWTPIGVPLATDCVTIPDVGVNPIISGIDGNFFANRLTIENEGSLIVEGTNTITVTNEIKVLGNGIFMFENNASLLQTTNAVNTGNIIYKRSSKPMRRYDVTHWSSPVTRNPAFRAIDFSPATLVDKYNRYDPATGWIEISPSEEMVKGVGYSIRAPQPFAIDSYDTFHGEFIGVPNNGDILGPTPIAGKYVFVGNPYPSALYADQFIYDNQDNIYGTLLIWTHNTLPQKNSSGDGIYYYSDNDYAFYNLSGSVAVGSMNGTGATNPGNQDKPEGYIAAGQGFLVRSKTNQKVLFTNSMRKPGRNSQFFKSAASIEIERHRVWLNLSNAQGAFKQLLIGYATGATNFWDNNFDALSVDAHPYIDFYSINEGKKLVIQGRALPFTVSDSIPLGYRSAIEGEFTIAIDHKDGNLNNQAVYLQDNVTKKVHDLSTGNYTFTTKTGVYQKRFVLRYMDPNVTLGNDDFTNLDRNISVSVKDKNITLQSFSDDQNLQEVSVYDVGGKLLYNKNAIDNKEWIITNLRSGPQVLLVKIKLDNGQTVTRKIVYN